MKTTSTPTRPEPKFPTRVLLAVTGFTVLVLGIAGYHHWQHPQPHGTVNAADGDPAMVTPIPSPTAAAASLNLSVNFPALSDEQLHYEHMAQTIWRIPLAFGVDRPPLKFSDNEAAIFTALVYGECSFLPYDELGNFKVNSIGARGCGQLLGGNITPENMWNVELNMYDAAAYFRDCIDSAGGDIMGALRHYRGVADSEHDGAATSVWSYLRVGGK